MGTLRLVFFLSVGTLVLSEGVARLYYLVRTPVASTMEARLANVENNDSKFDTTHLETFQKETSDCGSKQWSPFVYQRRVDCSRPHVNVIDRKRHTINRIESENAKTKIFVFGASSAWGTGVLDSGTIPTLLSKELFERGYADVHVTNFGEGGFVTTQEFIELQKTIQAGNVPQVAVFYDGLSDIVSSFLNNRVGVTHHEEMYPQMLERIRQPPGYGELIRRDSSLLKGLSNLKAKLSRSREIAGGPSGEKDFEALTRSTLDVYFTNLRAASALGKEFGFETYFFFQPSTYTKKHLTAAERDVADEEERAWNSMSPGQGEALTRIVALFLQRLSDYPSVPKNFADLRTIFDDSPKTMFWDPMHTTEKGNAVIAASIAKTLIERSQKLLPPSSRLN